MLHTYRTQKPSDVSLALADKLIDVMISSGATYRELADALEAAADRLEASTRPVSAGTPLQPD